jgi:hypothetical protein
MVQMKETDLVASKEERMERATGPYLVASMVKMKGPWTERDLTFPGVHDWQQ